MVYDSLFHKTLTKIPGTTKEEIGLAIESLMYIIDTIVKDAVKDMATKADIKDMATKADIKDMATKADIKDMELKISQMETRLFRKMFGMFMATTLLNVSIVSLILQLPF